MRSEREERLRNELLLLEAMYPDQVVWNATSRELTYTSERRRFKLRLPDGYLLDQLPQVILAEIERRDAQGQLSRHVQTYDHGEEMLDSVISAFNELSESTANNEAIDEVESEARPDALSKATMIVWLHHLLNTNKRKQALSPSSPGVSGLTKPGYPGVLVYSGVAEAVHEHVNSLKQLNWQAFQVRFESPEEWTFAHGTGVKEVEAMKDVVAEVGLERKESFLEAMRMK